MVIKLNTSIVITYKIYKYKKPKKSPKKTPKKNPKQTKKNHWAGFFKKKTRVFSNPDYFATCIPPPSPF